jgi:hypothetical protein
MIPLTTLSVPGVQVPAVAVVYPAPLELVVWGVLQPDGTARVASDPDTNDPDGAPNVKVRVLPEVAAYAAVGDTAMVPCPSEAAACTVTVGWLATPVRLPLEPSRVSVVKVVVPTPPAVAPAFAP